MNPVHCHDDRPVPSTPSKSLPHSSDLISLDEWQGYVDGHPDRTPLHDRRWIELLASHYGFDLLLPAIRCDGRIVAATAFAKTRTMLGTRRLISMPFTDCFSPLSNDVDATGRLMEFIARRFNASSISVRTDTAIDGYSHNLHWRRHRIRLRPEMSDLLPMLHASTRRNVKRAIDHGLRFERCTSMRAVEEFYRLHVWTRRKLGIPVQSKSYFRRVHEKIVEPGLGFVGMVRSKECAVAAGIFLVDDRTMMYKYGASDPAALDLRPNDFLFLNAIQMAAGPCEFFDFGVTHADNVGLCRFKRKWRADEEQAYDVCIAGKSRPVTRNSPVVKAASVVIRRSPTFVCRTLGRSLLPVRRLNESERRIRGAERPISAVAGVARLRWLRDARFIPRILANPATEICCTALAKTADDNP